MDLTSNKIPLLILGATSLTFSRILFFFFNDPEGPNLLIVVGLAAVIYIVSLSPYMLTLSKFAKFAVAVCIQVAILGLLYLFM